MWTVLRGFGAVGEIMPTEHIPSTCRRRRRIDLFTERGKAGRAKKMPMHGRAVMVDDDAELMKLLGLVLTRKGIETMGVRSGGEALSALAAEHFDVVLTDVRMPGMDGIAISERAVSVHPDLPVIMLTAFGSMEAAIAAIGEGAYDFVTKRVDKTVFMAGHAPAETNVLSISAAITSSCWVPP